MKIEKFNEKFYFIVNIETSYEQLEFKLLKKSAIKKDSFAYIYVKKIYKDIFTNAIDLKNEYLEFYSKEYDDFEIFLYQKELLEHNEITKLQITDTTTLLKLQMDLNNYNISNLLEYEDGMIEYINEILEDIENEN